MKSVPVRPCVQRKTFRRKIIGLGFAFALGLWLTPVPSRSDMAAPTEVSLSEVKSLLLDLKSKRKLSVDEAGVLQLAELGRDVANIMDIETFNLSSRPAPGGESDAKSLAKSALKEMTPDAFADALAQQISLRAFWKTKVVTKRLVSMRENRDWFKKMFASSPTTWAWFLLQIDERKEAKELLLKSFEKTYSDVMKLEEKYAFDDNTPILRQEWIVEGLESISSKSEIDELKARLQKIKIRYSKLPDSGIVT